MRLATLTKFMLAIAWPRLVCAETVPETIPVNIMVCDTPEHAVAYSAAVHKGMQEDEAKNLIGREAGSEVCDKLVGQVSVDEQKMLESDGITYKVSALKYSGVNKFRWVAVPQK